MKNLTAFLALLFMAVAVCPAQTKPNPTPNLLPDKGVVSSSAFAEVILRQTELESELESLLVDYTEDFPKVKEIRLELDFLKAEKNKLIAVKPAETGKLTLALGKLIVTKVGKLAAWKSLQAQYQESHPSVRKAKRIVDVYEKAISEILN